MRREWGQKLYFTKQLFLIEMDTGRSPMEIRSRESGLVGAAASELGVAGASGSGGAWGSGQTALVWSGDAEE